MSTQSKPEHPRPEQGRRPEDYLGGAALPVKDVLRGLRHGLRSVRDTAFSLQSRLPGPLSTLGAATIDHVDWLATKVDRHSSEMVHRYLDPLLVRDADQAIFSKLIRSPNAPVLFAKVVYDHLKPAVAYIARTLDRSDHVFVSEMMAAVAYRRVAETSLDADDEIGQAARLLASMLESGVVRASTGQNAANAADAETRNLARMASAAVVLWLVVKADEDQDDEAALLFTCADLAMALEDEIDAAGNDEAALGDFLRHYVGMI